MLPIPETQSNDIRWQADHLRLADSLIQQGAKPKLIRRFTNLSKTEVRLLWHSVRQDKLASGPVGLQSPRFFTTARDSASGPGPIWNIQGAMFLESVKWLQQSVPFKVNKGWLLVNAFAAYQRMMNTFDVNRSFKQLDINQAYSLMVLSGITNSQEYGEVALHKCNCHQRNYLIETALDISGQRCPLLLIEQHYQSLINAGQRGNKIRWSKAA